MTDLPHKKGFVEKELRRVAEDYLHGPASNQQYFNMLVAEALLILLERTKGERVAKLKQGGK